MDAILNLPPDLPVHADTPPAFVKSSVVAIWPVGTFVENLAVLSDGMLAVAVHTSNAVERVSPAGHRSVACNLPVPPTGLVARTGGGFYVAAGNPGQSPGRVWRVDGDGGTELALEIGEAVFLNGLTPLTPDLLLAADSILGRIYRLDLKARTAEVWLADERLGKITSFPFMPGANGLKLSGGYVYVTNTDRAILCRARVDSNGRAGSLEVVAEQLRGDDFAFDADGTAYIATHIENSVVRYLPDGDRAAVAGPEEGMAGSTAVAFGRLDRDQRSLYVTTTGGLVRPYGGVVREAKLVRLEIGIAGAVIPFAN